jgi:hypothetical protein
MLLLSLSETGLFKYLTKKSKPPKLGREYRNPNQTTKNPAQHVTVGSAVVIRLTTHENEALPLQLAFFPCRLLAAVSRQAAGC